jgi:hypothetical protein
MSDQPFIAALDIGRRFEPWAGSYPDGKPWWCNVGVSDDRSRRGDRAGTTARPMAVGFVSVGGLRGMPHETAAQRGDAYRLDGGSRPVPATHGSRTPQNSCGSRLTARTDWACGRVS